MRRMRGTEQQLVGTGGSCCQRPKGSCTACCTLGQLDQLATGSVLVLVFVKAACLSQVDPDCSFSHA